MKKKVETKYGIKVCKQFEALFIGLITIIIF